MKRRDRERERGKVYGGSGKEEERAEEGMRVEKEEGSKRRERMGSGGEW